MKYPIQDASERRGGSYYRVGDELIPAEDVEYLAEVGVAPQKETVSQPKADPAESEE